MNWTDWTDLIPVIAVVGVALALAALAIALRDKKPFEALDRSIQRFDQLEDDLVEHQQQQAEDALCEVSVVLSEDLNQAWSAVVNDDHTEAVFFDPAAETEVFSKLDDSENTQVTTDPAPGENTEPANDRGRHELDEDGDDHQAIPFLTLYARLREEEAVNARLRKGFVGTATAMAATVALPIYESMVSDFGEPLWSLVS